jgi:hypothetical protein
VREEFSVVEAIWLGIICDSNLWNFLPSLRKCLLCTCYVSGTVQRPGSDASSRWSVPCRHSIALWSRAGLPGAGGLVLQTWAALLVTFSVWP